MTRTEKHAAPTSTPEPSEEAIRIRSYQIWEREGKPQGRDGEHWTLARQELIAERIVAAAPAKRPTKATAKGKPKLTAKTSAAQKKIAKTTEPDATPKTATAKKSKKIKIKSTRASARKPTDTPQADSSI